MLNSSWISGLLSAAETRVACLETVVQTTNTYDLTTIGLFIVHTSWHTKLEIGLRSLSPEPITVKMMVKAKSIVLDTQFS